MRKANTGNWLEERPLEGRALAIRPRQIKLVPPATFCTASQRGTYHTGDGDVVQAIRPGALVAFSLPSLGTGG